MPYRAILSEPMQPIASAYCHLASFATSAAHASAARIDAQRERSSKFYSYSHASLQSQISKSSRQESQILFHGGPVQTVHYATCACIALPWPIKPFLCRLRPDHAFQRLPAWCGAREPDTWGTHLKDCQQLQTRMCCSAGAKSDRG